MNYGLDSAVILWQRAEVYLTQAWLQLDCYLPEESNIRTSHSIGGRPK